MNTCINYTRHERVNVAAIRSSQRVNMYLDLSSVFSLLIFSPSYSPSSSLLNPADTLSGERGAYKTKQTVPVSKEVKLEVNK